MDRPRCCPSCSRSAVVAQALLLDELIVRADRAAIRRSVSEIVAERAFQPVYQPIVDLATDEVVGFEALTRFADGSDPEHRFQEARRASASVELELATIDAAISAAALLPLGRWLNLNVSPDVLLATDELRPLVAQARQRVVLEIARGERIDDYAAVRAAVDRLGAGVDLAVGEGGDGSSSLGRIVELAPDFLKLDMSLVRRVDTDPARQALVAGLVHFSGLVGCRLIAEGVAAEAERRALRTLGVRLGQGNLLGRPASALRHTQTIDTRARQSSARQARPRRGRPAPRPMSRRVAADGPRLVIDVPAFVRDMGITPQVSTGRPVTYSTIEPSDWPVLREVGRVDDGASRSYLAAMRAVGLKILKNRLSEYVRLAASGETILVTDRERVVAELTPPLQGRAVLAQDAILADAVRKGWLSAAVGAADASIPRHPVAPLEQLLAEVELDRADR